MKQTENKTKRKKNIIREISREENGTKKRKNDKSTTAITMKRTK